MHLIERMQSMISAAKVVITHLPMCVHFLQTKVKQLDYIPTLTIPCSSFGWTKSWIKGKLSSNTRIGIYFIVFMGAVNSLFDPQNKSKSSVENKKKISN